MRSRMGIKEDKKLSDSRGYLESGARPNEITSNMKENNAGAASEHLHGLTPSSTLNDKMNGE